MEELDERTAPADVLRGHHAGTDDFLPLQRHQNGQRGGVNSVVVAKQRKAQPMQVVPFCYERPESKKLVKGKFYESQRFPQSGGAGRSVLSDGDALPWRKAADH
jgi:hypothetical protein